MFSTNNIVLLYSDYRLISVGPSPDSSRLFTRINRTRYGGGREKGWARQRIKWVSCPYKSFHFKNKSYGNNYCKKTSWYGSLLKKRSLLKHVHVVHVVHAFVKNRVSRVPRVRENQQ